MEPPSTDDPGFEAYEQISGLLEEIQRVAGEAGMPKMFATVVDWNRKGAKPGSREVELFVFGNMSVDEAEAVLPSAIRQYTGEALAPSAGEETI